ncbi:MAG: AbrB/MazE/SpoVT family DNA-binding domain-containing protein [Candidatus Chisholmbacteria bacterium]|nr:AbrB/MazE/SpoVT family DNA-binding domain-containing protein [Candidatus Chisholmbacteria bacterium]
MHLVTIGTKNQIVIPKEIRQKIPGIKPGAKVGIQSDGKAITIKPAAADWVEQTAGIMKEAWKDIDPIAELEKMRDEWDEKSLKLRHELKKR